MYCYLLFTYLEIKPIGISNLPKVILGSNSVLTHIHNKKFSHCTWANK